LIWCGVFQCVLRTDFHALWAFFDILTLIAKYCQLCLMVDRDGAEVTGFNSPGAAIAFVGVDVDDAVFLVLGERIPGAGDHAGGVLAGTAGNSRDQHLIHPHRSDAAAVGVEFTRFCV
jgi:hypothetical protein